MTINQVPTDAEKYGVDQVPAVDPAADNSIEPGTTDGHAENGGGR